MKRTILALMIITLVGCVSCTKVNKKTVLSTNVSQDVKEEISEKKQMLMKAKEALDKYDYLNAKLYYERAIALDQSNKEIYLKIKDQYLEAERYDDAYYIIKTAIDNNVEITSMSEVLSEIKTNFDLIEITNYVEQGDEFNLPQSIKAKVNDEEIDITINWNGAIANSSEVGTYTYEGSNDQYGRSIKLYLVVQDKVEEKTVISDVDIKNLIIEGEQRIYDIWNGKNYNSDDIIERENANSYISQYAESKEYKSKEQIEIYLSPYYSEEFLAAIIKKNVILENNKLYILYAQPSPVPTDTSNFQIIRLDDEITVEVSWQEDFNSEYKIIWENGSWKMKKSRIIG